ncbi:uroporphyrinogen-III synthase [Aequorivita sediminis]|uniref:uroporphyrinogen-III synthase n=1 Tax=Aequorivita sediminis TaxID=3073653 RepID=UPI0028A64241|nr:uroporphyrinogen-III synthase [Aequorivita sp. F6058]
MKSVLSTKKLSFSQRELLLNAGVSLVEYNAIKIGFIEFIAPSKIENAIITSQNSVSAIQKANIKIRNCYCVGEKTKALLEKNGQKVIKMTEYASELAPYLVENHKNDHFYFFCGNIRSDVIPSALNENNVSFEEIKVYNTSLQLKKIERQFDAIMFFSPSGVRSYYKENKSEALAVCIGTTTASEAKNYTDKVVVSNATVVESVIAKTVKMLRT